MQLHPFSIWKNCRYVPLSYFTLRPLITSSRLPIFSQCVAIILLSSSALSLPYYPTFLEQNEGQQEVTEKVTAPVWRCCYQFWLIISFLVFPLCTSTFPQNLLNTLSAQNWMMTLLNILLNHCNFTAKFSENFKFLKLQIQETFITFRKLYGLLDAIY